MKNLKIKTKFILGFGTLLFMLIALGITSFISIKNLNSVIDDYRLKTVPNTVSIWEMRFNMLSIQRYTLRIISTPDKEEAQHLVNNSATVRQELIESVERFRKNSRTGTALVDKFLDIINSATVYREEIETLSLKSTQEANKEAYEIYVNNYLPTLENAYSVLEEITVQVEELAAKQEVVAANTSYVAQTTVFVVLILALIFSFIIITIMGRAIIKPIVRLEKVASELSAGKLNVNLSAESKDEIGMLTQSFIKVRDVFNLFVKKINLLTNELEKGDIDYRISDSEFEGEYKDAVIAINTVVSSLVSDNQEITDAFSKFGKGDFNAEIKKFPGKKADINIIFNTLKGNLVSVNTDITKLINAAIDGKLDSKVDTNIYEGDWKKITQGLNSLLDSINTPIKEANDILIQLSEGNFNVTVNKNHKGIFSEMMNCFEIMVTSIGSYITEIADVLKEVADGNLKHSISREYIGQFNIIKNSINNITDTLSSTISEIKMSADNVLFGARQISETSLDLANGASTQASSIEELNATINVINEQTRESALKAQNADNYSKKSMESAKIGNDEMLKMLSSMEDIKEASNNISKIIKVIDEIAFQTNLLALNAAVEAARAGEHGKGFAVVAQEVRSLAGRSQQAAKETSTLIQDTISKVGEGTEIAQQTADSLQAIVLDANKVSEIIDDIYKSSEKQAEGIEQITLGINEISGVVQSTSATSEEAAATAQELSSQSELLTQKVESFSF